MNYNIHLIDYLVIFIYLAGIFFLAYFSGRKYSTDNLVEEQYLAGKSLTFTESLSSIIATEVSALTFLGVPAFAYGKDFSFIQIYFGAVFGRFLIAQVMLPLVYNKGLTIYSAMGENGTPTGQRSIALFYALNKFLAVGVRLFSGSILVAEFFNISIYIAVGIICVITFFYTLIGGLKAVVRTDMVQMALFIFGGIVAHILIPQVANQPWEDLIAVASAAGRTSFIDFNNFSSFLIGVAGGILFDMATHGVDQDFAQRLTANRSINDAKKAIILSSAASILVGLLFLSIGALLYGYYQTHTAPDISNDKLFAYFITQHFPIGIKGLMVAGVLAATMSTLDSTINALSATFYNDIMGHEIHQKQEVQKFYFRDTLGITAILMLIAFIASTSDQLLLLGLKITSWTAGSLLALFFATLVFKTSRLTMSNVVIGYAVGVTGVYINTYLLEWDWNFNVYFGFIFASVALLALGKASRD